MKIGLLGTGNLAVTLGKAWVGAGHSIVATGRNPELARDAVQQIGAAAPVDPRNLAEAADVVVVAITWAGLESALTLVGAPNGTLAGKTVIDCTNPVDYATGRILPESGSAAEHEAHIATGAHVVKALHLFAGATWPFMGEPATSPVVPICGDDAHALSLAEALIADLGARTARLGGLDAARQAEEAAGFGDAGGHRWSKPPLRGSGRGPSTPSRRGRRPVTHLPSREPLPRRSPWPAGMSMGRFREARTSTITLVHSKQ